MPDPKQNPPPAKDPAPPADEKPAAEMTPAEISAKGAAAKARGTSSLIITHGHYVGPGCPDPANRKREEDRGFRYDHDHPGVPGERIEGLSPNEVKRMVATKCFKSPPSVDDAEG